MTWRLRSTNRAEPWHIEVPECDPLMDPDCLGDVLVLFSRSVVAEGTGVTTPREFANEVSSFIDASTVYGSDAVRSAALRTFDGGKLRTSAGNLLPFNTGGLDNQPAPTADFFLAGDVRANENALLTAIQTIFMREHNRLAINIAASDYTGADLSDPEIDEAIFQKARRLVAAQVQAITYYEYLPSLLGSAALAPYEGYDASVNPTTALEFSSAAFRFGHAQVGNSFGQLYPIRHANFNPEIIIDDGVEPILSGSAQALAREVDTFVEEEIRTWLFAPDGDPPGLDIAAIDIQRGRDRGLADYNTTRVHYGLAPVTSFGQISSDPATVTRLQNAYPTVNDMDLWTAGLAEDHLPGGSLGETFAAIIIDEFQRLRDGDRFYFENDLSEAELAEIRNTRLSDIILRNSTITEIHDEVFLAPEALTHRAASNAQPNELVASVHGASIQVSDRYAPTSQQPLTDTERVVLRGALDGSATTFVIDTQSWPSATDVVIDGIAFDSLVVEGTSGSDTIQLAPNRITVNDVVIAFTGVTKIEVKSGGGQDVFLADPSFERSGVHGEQGEDVAVPLGGRTRADYGRRGSRIQPTERSVEQAPASGGLSGRQALRGGRIRRQSGSL